MKILKKGSVILLISFVLNLIFGLIFNGDVIYSFLASLLFSPMIALFILRQSHFENDIFGRWLFHILIWLNISAFIASGIAFCLFSPFGIKANLIFALFYFIPPFLVFFRYRKLIRRIV